MIKATYRLGIDWKDHKTKPKDSLIDTIKKSCIKNYKYYTFEEAITLIGDQGRSVVPSYLIGGTKKENFEEIQIFMLDFDSKEEKTSFAEVKERAEKCGLRIAGAYKTFHCCDNGIEDRFRVIFIHEYPISDKNVANLIYQLLGKIFGRKVDKNCLELSRLFHGGKGIIYYDPSEPRFNIVQSLFPIYDYMNRNKNYIRDLKQILKKNNEIDIAIIDGKLAIDYYSRISCFDGKIDPANIVIIGESTPAPIFYVKRGGVLHESNTCEKNKSKSPFNITISDHLDMCKMLNDFTDGVDLAHEDKFRIATNLINIVGGRKYFYETYETYAETESYEKWVRDEKYFKDYLPMSCVGCKYYDTCAKQSGDKNIAQRLLNDRRIIVKEETTYVDRYIAERSLYDNIQYCVNSPIKGIFLMMAQTGMGKTCAIIKVISEIYKNTKSRVLVAEPTCLMMEQFYRDLLRMGECKVDDVYLNQTVRNSPYLSLEEIECYCDMHQNGHHKEAKKPIRDMLDMLKKNYPEKIEKIENLNAILKGLSAAKDKRVVIISHAMLLNISQEILDGFDMVFVDEDILYLQMLSAQMNVSKSSLECVRDNSCNEYSTVSKKMLLAKPNVYYHADWEYENVKPFDEYKNRDDDEEDYTDQVMLDGNINDIVYAGSYVMDENGNFSYLRRFKLKDAKFIILSATLDSQIYRDYFKGQKEIVECDFLQAEYQGHVKQFTYHSLGRTDLNKKREYIYRFIKEDIGENFPIMSFKSENTGCPIHFGNAMGINAYKGKDIIVLGTDFKHPNAYMLPAAMIYGCDFQKEKMRTRRVEYNGKSIRLMTFEDPRLQRLEMYSLRSEMEQVVGRARALRFDCNVYVLSCFPCDQAEYITYDYLKKYGITDEDNDQNTDEEEADQPLD